MEVIYFLFVIWLSLIKEIQCDCGKDKSSESCWYTFWYIWVALALFVAVLITIMVFYYKHKARHRTRVRRISAARPQNPPPYSVPSQLPPSYEDAIKDSLPVPPGYVTDYRIISQYHNNTINREPSEISTISYPPSYIEGNLPPRQQSQPMDSHNHNNSVRQLNLANRNRAQQNQTAAQRNNSSGPQSSNTPRIVPLRIQQPNNRNDIDNNQAGRGSGNGQDSSNVPISRRNISLQQHANIVAQATMNNQSQSTNQQSQNNNRRSQNVNQQPQNSNQQPQNSSQQQPSTDQQNGLGNVNQQARSAQQVLGVSARRQSQRRQSNIPINPRVHNRNSATTEDVAIPGQA